VEDLPVIGIGVGALSLPFLYLLWVAARRVIKWGFFIFYTVVGALPSYAGLWYVEAPAAQVLPYSVIAGISFASVCMAIRAKIARLIGIIFVVAMVALIGWRLYN
jgi:hypothetical protein